MRGNIKILSKVVCLIAVSIFSFFSLLSSDSGISYNKLNESISLKICNYNMGLYNHGVPGEYTGSDFDKKINNIKNFISANDFDIMCLEENSTYLDEEKTITSDDVVLSDAFPYTYRGLFYLTISSKYKLTECEMGFFKAAYADNERGYVKSVIMLNNKRVVLFSCHPSWQPEAAETRKAQMEEIIEMFKNEERVILFGDWNVQSFSEFDTLINAGYKSINGRYAPLQRSYNSEQNYTETADKTKDKYFDNILIKGSFVGTLKVHDVYDQLLSDHLPVSAEITMK